MDWRGIDNALELSSMADKKIAGQMSDLRSAGYSSQLESEGSAAYNIERSKQLIKTLELTTRQSATVVKRARLFYETCQLLETSRMMSTSALEQLNRSRRK